MATVPEMMANRLAIPSDEPVVKNEKLGRIEPLVLSTLALIVGVVGSVYLAFYIHFINSDALTRVLNAYYTIFSSKFHLAAMGFVWNPLPSILELPFVMFRHWFPQLVAVGFAGNIVSAIASAGAVYFVDRILFYLYVPRFWRYALTILYMLNPMIWLFSSNGMSESLMLVTMLGSLSGALAYLRTGRHSGLISAGFWLAACFGARYEAIPYGMALAAGLLVALLLRRYSAQRIQADLILAGFPLLFAAIVWILVNWMIMGDPLYFLHSSYSNAAQIATGSYNDRLIVRDEGHLLYSLESVMHFTFLFPPVILGFAGGLLLLLFSRESRERSALILAAMLAVPVFQVVMIDKHASAMWARFFITYIPTGIFLIAMMFQTWARGNRVLLHLSMLVVTVLVVAGNYFTFINMQTQDLGRGVVTQFHYIITGQSMANNSQNASLSQGEAVANYINSHPKMVVLLDTFDAFSVVPFIDRPTQVVITSDLQFQSILLNPRGRVTDFLVPSPTGIGSLDAITRTYPGMWSGKVSWTSQEKQFPGTLQFRLFAVEPTAP